jgi:hypothetical protein
MAFHDTIGTAETRDFGSCGQRAAIDGQAFDSGFAGRHGPGVAGGG